ncbi:MAG: 23S rRNA (cytidine1920-2'-O)/16S rRNA (cytidine1409-2'-O)-methyltransferase [Myxococcota bacterium]
MRRGLVPSRAAAVEAIEADLVTVDGAPAGKPASQVLASASLRLARPPRRFVSRGGGKLAHALDVFDVDPSDRYCLDAGISTGGFTHCLLERGAVHVVGVDVGYGQVAEAVRVDARVDVRERTNIRALTASDLQQPVSLIVCDVSFIALRTVLPTLVSLCDARGEIVALVKPQFEAGRSHVGSGGVVRDPIVWERVLREVAATTSQLGWTTVGVTTSPLPGPAGNVEFLVHLRSAVAGSDGLSGAALDDAVTAAVDAARVLARAAGVALSSPGESPNESPGESPGASRGESPDEGLV